MQIPTVLGLPINVSHALPGHTRNAGKRFVFQLPQATTGMGRMTFPVLPVDSLLALQALQGVKFVEVVLTRKTRDQRIV